MMDERESNECKGGRRRKRINSKSNGRERNRKTMVMRKKRRNRKKRKKIIKKGNKTPPSETDLFLVHSSVLSYTRAATSKLIILSFFSFPCAISFSIKRKKHHHYHTITGP